MRPLIFGHFTGEELANDLDRLLQPLQPGGRLWPVFASDMLVQRLARAEAKVEPAGKHRLQRGRRLRQNRWMVARPRRRDTRPKDDAAGLRAERSEPRPDVRRLSLLRRPRLEVVRGHDAAKPNIFR